MAVIHRIIDGIRCFYDTGASEWHIECTTCDNYYTWKPEPPVPVIGVRYVISVQQSSDCSGCSLCTQKRK